MIFSQLASNITRHIFSLVEYESTMALKLPTNKEPQAALLSVYTIQY